MKKIYLLCTMVLGLSILLPTSPKADVLELYPAQTITVPTCSSGGGSSTTITTSGYYNMHVSGETANVCYASTCATGGMERKTGNHGVTYLRAGTSVSCRSTGSAAVVQLVPGGWIR